MEGISGRMSSCSEVVVMEEMVGIGGGDGSDGENKQ